MRVHTSLLLVLALAACEGPAGADGADGTDGSDGSDGADGADGSDGSDGSNGTDGTDGEDGEDGYARTLRFSDVAFPETDAQKRSVLASERAWVDGEEYDIGYNVILRSGDAPDGAGVFGKLYDQSGAVITDADGNEVISADTDFSSILAFSDGTVWSVTHFEDGPGALYLTELDQDAATGALTAVSTKSIDLSGVDGIYTPCAGIVTPWNTHLGGEEYPPDAQDWEDYTDSGDIDSYIRDHLRYYGFDIYTDTNADGVPDNASLASINASFNPYYLGWVHETTVDSGAGTASVEKHYSMGRTSVELAYVMPDEKTVYITVDGTNVGLFMYLADTAGDLSAGTLYAARWYQVDDEGGGRFDLEWLSLGHATDAEIQAIVESKPSFTDIFEIGTEYTSGNDGTCDEGFTSINTGYDDFECLKVRSGMELAASRLESDRYGAMLGGTFELRKEEGITFDPDNQRLYIAISEVARGMEDYARAGSARTTNDIGGPNDIRVAYNPCGLVYALDVLPHDTIGSDYVAANVYTLLEGTPYTYPDSSVYAENSCSVNGLAEPDNVTYIPGYELLIIGEDTSEHQNDMVWAYDLRFETLTRIFATPYGAETTSPYIYTNINGWAYLKTVIQHPFGESDADQLVDLAEANSYDGYLGPLPALD